MMIVTHALTGPWQRSMLPSRGGRSLVLSWSPLPSSLDASLGEINNHRFAALLQTPRQHLRVTFARLLSRSRCRRRTAVSRLHTHCRASNHPSMRVLLTPLLSCTHTRSSRLVAMGTLAFGTFASPSPSRSSSASLA